VPGASRSSARGARALISSRTRTELEEALGAAVVSEERLSGGSIAQAFAADLSDGRRVFLKESAGAEDMFSVEARGLAWLGEAGWRCIRKTARRCQ